MLNHQDRLVNLLDGMEMTKSEHDWLELRFANMTEKERLLFTGALELERPTQADRVMELANQLPCFDLYYGVWDDEALGRMLPGLLSAPRGAVGAAAGRLGYLGEHFGERSRQQLDGARGRLMRAGAAMTDPYRASVAVSAARLHDLSPLAIIGRGYAMAKGEDGRVVSSVDGVAAGERLGGTLSDGELDCTVNDVRRIHSAVEAWG